MKKASSCIKYNIPFGVYLYSYAKSINAAKSEAQHVLRLIEPYKGKLSYPVYYDLEEKGTEKGAVNRAIVFGDLVEKSGYWCGIYANEYWWKTYLKGDLNRFTKWVAKYSGKKPSEISGRYDMWQYTSKGKIPGINGTVDVNICYRDFPTEICRKSVNMTAKKSIFEIAKEVIGGKWGNGTDRKKRLTSAGYDYTEVQKEVNRILKGKDLKV